MAKVRCSSCGKLGHNLRTCQQGAPKGTRVCVSCGRRKRLALFHCAKNGSLGRRTECKKCSADSNKRWMKENRERHLERKRRYFSDPQKKRLYRDWSLQRTYGITIDEYEEMHRKQRGLCAICLKPEASKDRRGTRRALAVDHDHVTGKVRGLLCFRCNSALEAFDKDQSIVMRLKDYLWPSEALL